MSVSAPSFVPVRPDRVGADVGDRRAESVRWGMTRAVACLGSALFAVTLLTAPAAWAQEPTEPDAGPPVGMPIAAESAPARSEVGTPPGPDDESTARDAGGDPLDAGDDLRAGDDERTVVLAERVCETVVERSEVTLFANGTVRVRQRSEQPGAARQGGLGAPEMALGELPPDELEAWVDAVRSERLGESDRHSPGPVGDLVPRCSLRLDYDAMARWVGPPPPPRGDRSDWRPTGRREVEYGSLDSLGLGFSRVVERLEALMGRVDLAAGRRGLPPRYEPASGDVLRRADGLLFRIERSTASKGGWELQGVDQPLTLYVLEDDLPRLFTELVGRR